MGGGSAGNNNYRYCDRCSCRDYDCNRDCRKSVINNNNGYPSGGSSNSGNSGSSGSSWSSNSNTGWSSNNGGSYNTGWRVAGRTNEDSETTEEVASDTKFEQKVENVEEAVVFA